MKDLIIGIAVGITIGTIIAFALFYYLKPQSKPKSYSNLEEWEFIREPGTEKIIGIRAHRKANMI